MHKPRPIICRPSIPALSQQLRLISHSNNRLLDPAAALSCAWTETNAYFASRREIHNRHIIHHAVTQPYTCAFLDRQTATSLSAHTPALGRMRRPSQCGMHAMIPRHLNLQARPPSPRTERKFERKFERLQRRDARLIQHAPTCRSAPQQSRCDNSTFHGVVAANQRVSLQRLPRHTAAVDTRDLSALSRHAWVGTRLVEFRLNVTAWRLSTGVLKEGKARINRVHSLINGIRTALGPHCRLQLAADRRLPTFVARTTCIS